MAYGQNAPSCDPFNSWNKNYGQGDKQEKVKYYFLVNLTTSALVVKGGLFRVKVKRQRSRVKGQRSRATSGSFFVVTTSGSFFVLTITGSFFVLTTSCSFFVLIFFRVDPFRIFFRGGHSLAYFVDIHDREGGGRYHEE